MSKRRLFKYTAIAICTPVALFIILSLLLYFPPFQNWAVTKAAAVASEKTGMKISVGHVRLAFPLALSLEDVRAFEPNDSIKGKTDTVALVSRAVADVQLWPLFHKQVMVDELSLRDMQVNTTHFISDVRISGKVGELKVVAHGIDLSKEHVRVNHALLNNASLLVELSDTAKKDTSKTKNFWKIHLDDIRINNTAFALHTPGDTIAVALLMNKGKAQQVYMDLFKNLYAVNKLHWDGGWLNYDRQPVAVAPSGFDPNHIALRELQLDADSFSFCSPPLKVSIASAAFQEKSGLTVQRLHGPFRMDSTTLALPALRLKTPFTDLALSFRMDKNAFSTDLPADSTGAFTAIMRGSIGAHDLRSLASPYLPKNILNVWPRVPFVVNGRVGGNLHRLHINNMYLAMPGILRLQAGGFLTNVTVPEALRADMNVNARTGSLAFIKPLLPKSVTATVNIPQGIAFRGHVKMNGQQIASRFSASQGAAPSAVT